MRESHAAARASMAERFFAEHRLDGSRELEAEAKSLRFCPGYRRQRIA
jgi:hypothetical protein